MGQEVTGEETDLGRGGVESRKRERRRRKGGIPSSS